MLTCKKATELMTQGMDRKLRTTEKLHLKFHLMMCDGCQNFNKQMTFLRKACKRLFQWDD